MKETLLAAMPLGYAVAGVGLAAIVRLLPRLGGWTARKEAIIGWTGLVLLVMGCGAGLFLVPHEGFMGETGRIFFLHPPTALVTMLIASVAAVLAAGSLITREPAWERGNVATVEVALVMMLMVLVQGSIWGKATWGSFWEWDPRLTTTAILAVLYGGVLSLRSFSDEPRRRAAWTAVATIIAFLDVPIVYWVVDFAPGLHQQRSSPSTVSDVFILPFRMNCFALLNISVWNILRRARVLRLGERHAAAPQGSAIVAGGE